MILTVDNITDTTLPVVPLTLNALDVHDGGSGATGGQRKYPLPYPFAHIAPLAPGAVVSLPYSMSDWRYKAVPYQSTEPRQDWLQLINKGWVTLVTTKETPGVTRDPEDIAKDVVAI